MDINRADVTILTDRGTALLPAINECFDKPLKRPCPKHIAGNLVTLGYSKSSPLMNLYWKATNAKTLLQFTRIMCQMLDLPKGNLLLKLLLYDIK